MAQGFLWKAQFGGGNDEHDQPGAVGAGSCCIAPCRVFRSVDRPVPRLYTGLQPTLVQGISDQP